MAPPRSPTTRSRVIVSAVASAALLGVLIYSVWIHPEPKMVLPETVIITGETMATTYLVKVVVPTSGGGDTTGLRTTVAEELAAVNAAMSHYEPDSDISRLNRHASGDWLEMDAGVIEVLQLAQTVSERSGGAFDVTVGPLVGLWGFHRKQALDAEPTGEELTLARARIGYTKLEIDRETSAVRKMQPDVEIDLSAIAKGHAVDRIADVLLAQGHDRHLVEIGGEIRVQGTNAEGLPWRVGIERPLDDRREVHRALNIRDGAMATSGDYRSFYQLRGRRISHTIDPRSGRPVRHTVASVTVIHERCATADAWATALMVLGLDEGLAVATREDLAVLMLVRETDGGVSEHSTPAFLGFIEGEQELNAQ